MADILFYLFSTLTLVAAVGMVANRNLVSSAMLMIVSFVGVAALFVMLGAYFLAILQVLVYAGAVVVLFLFIIMLLNVEEAARLKPDIKTVVAAGLSTLLLGGIVLYAVLSGEPVEPALETHPSSQARSFGEELFTKYLLPMQVAGFLLLSAMIGVVVISRKQKTDTEAEGENTPEAKTGEVAQ